LGLGIFIIIFPFTIGLGSNAASLLVYGSFKPDLPPGSFIRILPLWAVLYSRLIWWVIWSATEEMTFNGYALPRLQLLTGKTWVAVLAVGFGWALQHSFLPFINAKHAMWLFITFFPLTIALQFVYLKYRRLFPIILGHWAMDFFSVVFMLRIG
jgi:membrane protease YdiL (CAAX protease family)